MMKVDPYFTDFLATIGLSGEDTIACTHEHTRLRRLLLVDPALRDIVITTFVQGSYRRATSVRALEGTRPDVDVVAVTTLSRSTYQPQAAIDLFKPFLRKHYSGQWRSQGRSFGIAGDMVNLDLVVAMTSPLEVQGTIARNADAIALEDTPHEREWKHKEALWIPDREVGRWEQTHPLAQLTWTRAKNRRTHGHYVNVVKAIKWWKLRQPSLPKHPKSYPLEHIVGSCCPDGITSVAEGVVRTLEAISTRFSSCAATGSVPILANRGLISQDVLSRVPAEHFQAFVKCATEAMHEARLALDSNDIIDTVIRWRKLFGAEFPAPHRAIGSRELTSSIEQSGRGRTRFG